LPDRKNIQDHALAALLDLDGVTFFVDTEKSYWVKFRIVPIQPTPEKPHGLSYTITLHEPSGKRIFGYDNAHPVQASAGPGGKKARPYDHMHREDTIRPYGFVDAATLLADFWSNVDKILEERSSRK